MSKQNCYDNPTTWNRYSISKVLKRNPGLKSALKLLGMNPEELAQKAMDRNKAIDMHEKRVNYLNAFSKPDRQVNAANHIPRGLVGKYKLMSAETLHAQKKTRQIQAVSEEEAKNLAVNYRTSCPGSITNPPANVHVGYSDGEVEVGECGVVTNEDLPRNNNLKGTKITGSKGRLASLKKSED